MADPGMNTGVGHIHVVDDIEKVFSVLSMELVSLSEWKFLMRRLDLTNEDLADIEYKHSSDGRREIIYQCMLRWHERVGEAASVVKLVRALRQERLHKVADTIKSYIVRTPCTRCPIGGHDPSCTMATPTGLTRQKTKIKTKPKQKFPSSIPKLPKIYSPSSSISSIRSTRRRSSGGSTSSGSSTKKPPKRRQRNMSCDSTTSVTSSILTNDESEPEVEVEEEEEDVPEPPEVDEPDADIPEQEEVVEEPPVENGLPTPSPEVQEEPTPEPVIQTPPKPEVKKQVLQERQLTGHLRVEELIPDGGIPPNFTDLFKDMCAHLYKTIVKDAADNIRALEEIVKLKNFFVRNLVVGSVLIGMSCHGDPCYDELRARYKSGALLRACQQVFGRENLLRHLGLTYVRYSLYIDDFEDGVPPPEETFPEPAPAQPEEEEKKEEPIENKERKTSREEPPPKPKREKTVMVSVEVCARLMAHIDTDIPTSTLLQSMSETGYRAANARKFYKVITQDDIMSDAIKTMNKSASVPGMKFTRFDLKKDRVDIVMTCSSKKAINEAYGFFLRKELLKICKEVFLTKEIKKKAGQELIQLELEIDDEHITKCEKQFKEKLTKLKLNRTLERDNSQTFKGGVSERDSARAQGRTSGDLRRERTGIDPVKREKSVASPLNNSMSRMRRSSQESRRSSSGSTR